MTAIHIPPSEEAMPRDSYIPPPFMVTLSAASLLATLISGQEGSSLTTAAEAVSETAFEAAHTDATFGGALSDAQWSARIFESVGFDLPVGESFTDAQAAAIGLSLAQQRSGLPITEVDLGSDV